MNERPTSGLAFAAIAASLAAHAPIQHRMQVTILLRQSSREIGCARATRRHPKGKRRNH